MSLAVWLGVVRKCSAAVVGLIHHSSITAPGIHTL